MTTKMSTLTFEEVVEECKQDPPVELRPSKRHGTGVFATRDISKGDAVCYYDGHDVGEETGGITIQDHAYSVNWVPSWLPQNCAGRTRIGKRHPDTSYGIAQYINDSCFPDILSLVDPETQKISLSAAYQCMDRYRRKSHAVAMVSADPRPEAAPMWYFATRNIHKGEEIVACYGERYWSLQSLTIHNLTVRLVISFLYEHEYYEKLAKNLLTDDVQTIDILERYQLREAVNFAWKNGKWDEGDRKGKQLWLHELLWLLVVKLIEVDDQMYSENVE